jgi:membrane peptidoglycan carboxypeptidase
VKYSKKLNYEMPKNHTITFLDKNDNYFFEINNANKQSYITIENIDEDIINAIISIEDKNFYKHSGFDILRNIKAFFTNLFSFSIKQGASTISQQYARNTLLSTEKTLSRKIKEAFYTIQIERKYTKSQILEGYLNSLYLGHGLTGIDSASYYYFNKSAYDLTIAESAMLAGICNAPSIFSPKINLNNAIERQKLVLYRMLSEDYITQQEYQKALKEELTYSFEKQESSNLNYYKDSIINENNS